MSIRTVFVKDVIGQIDLSGPTAKVVSVSDQMSADDDRSEQSIAGRDVFMQRQADEWKRDEHTAEDGKSDATELDENGVARPDQTTGGLIAIAKQNAKNKARAKAKTEEGTEAAPRGRDLFMQRTSKTWRNGEAA